MNRHVLVRQAAKELGMTVKEVKEVYNAYWLEVKRILDSGPDPREDLTKAEFKARAGKIRLTGVGTLFFDYGRYLARRRHIKKTFKRKKDAEDKKD